MANHLNPVQRLLFEDGEWQPEHFADPLDGWDYGCQARQAPYMPTNDVYGRLYCFLRAIVREFAHRLVTVDIVMSVTHISPGELPSRLARNSFARIDVSQLDIVGARRQES